MNPVIENIFARRSVRIYAATPIPRDTLLTIIEASNMAPSGCNAQGWRYIIVEDCGFREKLADLALPKYKKWMENISGPLKDLREDIDKKTPDPVYYSAPAVVFVVGSGMTADFDCSMVCQNMMLAARSFGIGSCWVYFGQLVLDDAEIKKIFALSPEEKVYGPVLLGYPREGFPEAPAKKSPEIQWI